MGFRPTSEAFPVLIVINPNAGRKTSREQLTKTIQPTLDNAGVPYRVIETTSKGFAQEYFRDNIRQIFIDLVQSLAGAASSGAVSAQQGDTEGETGTGEGTTTTAATAGPPEVELKIMVIGGDGTVHEVINGILQGIHGSSPSSGPPFVNDNFRPKIELSIIPAGTGNAIATSQGVTNSQAALHCFLTGKSVPLRLVQVSQRNNASHANTTTTTTNSNGDNDSNSTQGAWKPVMYTAVVNSFGLHCATVFDAEGLRSFGNVRFKASALKNIAFLKQYPARVELFGPYQKYDRPSHQLIANTNTAIASPQHDQQQQQQQQQQQPSVTLPGPFTYLMLTKQPTLEPGFVPTPFANTSDEWLDILAVQNAGRGQILDILGDAVKEGLHVKRHDKVDYYKAKVVEIETPAQGRLCVDGEFLDIAAGPEGRVRFEVVSDPNIQLFHLSI
ncbi:ATP-NAD kinase-like domain-containing protein [Linnemannia elongata]|nr:ATP-NAD kinase-like domain-containing protein [Linnemannia elongata]